MSVTPIAARCSHCGADFQLFELVEQRTGACPRCNRALSPDWTPHLLEAAQHADVAMRQLVASLRRLDSLPGNLAVRPSSVMRNLFEETGWQRELAENPALLHEELPVLRRVVNAWEALDRESIATAPKGGWLRRRVDLLLGRDHVTTTAAPNAAV